MSIKLSIVSISGNIDTTDITRKVNTKNISTFVQNTIDSFEGKDFINRIKKMTPEKAREHFLEKWNSYDEDSFSAVIYEEFYNGQVEKLLNMCSPKGHTDKNILIKLDELLNTYQDKDNIYWGEIFMLLEDSLQKTNSRKTIENAVDSAIKIRKILLKYKSQNPNIVLYFNKNKFNQEVYNISIMKKHDEDMTTYIDRKGNKVGTSWCKELRNGKIIYFEKDIKNNKTILSKYDENDILLEQTTKIYDKSGKLIRTELIKESPIEGNYDIFYHYPDGRIEVTARAFKDPTSNEQIVKHNLVSNSGVKTRTKYETLSNGDEKSEYLIINRDEKIISRQRAARKNIDDNHYITTRNGQSYDVQFTDEQITVTRIKNRKLTEEKVTFNLAEAPIIKNYFWGDHLDLENKNKIFDKKLVPLLKRLSGDEFFAMKKNEVKQILFDSSPGELNNAYWSKSDNRIVIGSNCKEFSLNHELGHSKDIPGYIKKQDADNTANNKIGFKLTLYSNNPKFIEIYSKEKEQFIKQAANEEINSLRNFILTKDGGHTEVFGEANSIKNGIQTDKDIALRSVMLSQHFPESLAYAFRYLNETAKRIKTYVFKD